jgi:hypothetical protein
MDLYYLTKLKSIDTSVVVIIVAAVTTVIGDPIADRISSPGSKTRPHSVAYEMNKFKKIDEKSKSADE